MASSTAAKNWCLSKTFFSIWSLINPPQKKWQSKVPIFDMFDSFKSPTFQHSHSWNESGRKFRPVDSRIVLYVSWLTNVAKKTCYRIFVFNFFVRSWKTKRFLTLAKIAPMVNLLQESLTKKFRRLGWDGSQRSGWERCRYVGSVFVDENLCHQWVFCSLHVTLIQIHLKVFSTKKQTHLEMWELIFWNIFYVDVLS